MKLALKYRWREISAALLMVVGVAMMVRGIHFSVRQGLGWQGLVQAVVVGGLVFALGIARWRYWRQR